MVWRFGAEGLLVQSLSLPTLGLFGLLWVGYYGRRKRTLLAARAMSVVLWLTALAVLGMFVLDFRDMRQVVNPEVLATMDRDAFRAIWYGFLNATAYTALVVTGWLAVCRSGRSTQPPPASHLLVVPNSPPDPTRK